MNEEFFFVFVFFLVEKEFFFNSLTDKVKNEKGGLEFGSKHSSIVLVSSLSLSLLLFSRKLISLFLSFLLLTATYSVVAFASSSSQTFLYDANGNMISDSQNYYEYNDANQLFRVRKGNSTGTIIAEYFYDHEGKRVKKNESGVVTYYIGNYFETKVYPDGRTENTSYYFANGERVARKDPDGKMYFYHSDHLGSTNVITNSSGQVVEKTKYYPFGEVRVGGTQSKFLFTGEEKDAETGLYYYGARYYNPLIRRWTQPDPIIQDPYDPQNLNRYSYVVNNPLKYVDPTGSIIESIPDVISLIYNTYMWRETYDEEYRQSAQWDYAALMIPFVPGSWIKRPIKWGLGVVPNSLIVKIARESHSAAKLLGYSDEFVQAVKSGEKIMDMTKVGKKTIWLAEGSTKKGWKHIVEGRKLGTDESDFARAFGKEYADLGKSKELIMRTVKEGKYVSDGGGAYLMKVTEKYYIRVGVSKTGEIITAHPEETKKAIKILSKYA